MKFWLIAGVIALCPAAALAQKSNADRQMVTVYGYPKESCGVWVEARKSSSKVNEWMMERYVEGFVTGSGVFGEPLRTSDLDAFRTWLDVYCGAHPMDMFVSAVSQMTVTLRVKTSDQ